MTSTLEALGFTREDILNALVEKLVEGFTSEEICGDLEARVNRETRKFIDSKIAELVNAKCEAVFTPIIEKKLDDYMFQQTNGWGEKTGKALTFTEFLVARTEQFMLEDIDSRGRNREQCASARDNFTPLGSRVTVAIRHFFNDAMQTAMKAILSDSAKILSEGIEKAAQDALGDIRKRLVAKVAVQ